MPQTRTEQADWNNSTKPPKAAAAQWTAAAKLWTNAIFPVDGGVNEAKNAISKQKAKTEAQRGILTRAFAILRYGGVKFHTGPKAAWTLQWPHPTVSLLSHGGRVLVAVKKGSGLSETTPWDFFNWLATGNLTGGAAHVENAAAGFKARAASTHGVIWDDSAAEDGLKEDKYNMLGAAIRALGSRHNNFGMNIAMGGPGGVDAAGNIIPFATGSYGHFFVYARACPADSTGDVILTLLLGAENAAPPQFGGETTSHLGGEHSITGSKNKTSLCGCDKWEGVAVTPKACEPDGFRVVIDLPTKLTAIQNGARGLTTGDLFSTAILQNPAACPPPLTRT
jgi:hypothetical protein